MDEKRKREIERTAKEQSSRPIFFPPGRRSDEEQEHRKAMRENAPYLTLGFQMAIIIALGAFIGKNVDDANGTNLWIGLGAGIGAVIGMTYFVLTVVRMSNRDNKPKNPEPKNPE